MKTRLWGFALNSKRRASTQARRLRAILRQYAADPVRNYRLHSEAAALARSVSYYLRDWECVGRVILTEDGERRQVFLPYAG